MGKESQMKSAEEWACSQSWENVHMEYLKENIRQIQADALQYAREVMAFRWNHAKFGEPDNTDRVAFRKVHEDLNLAIQELENQKK